MISVPNYSNSPNVLAKERREASCGLNTGRLAARLVVANDEAFSSLLTHVTGRMRCCPPIGGALCVALATISMKKCAKNCEHVLVRALHLNDITGLKRNKIVQNRSKSAE